MKKRAVEFRKESVSESTRKNREMQWLSYTRACKIYDWEVYPCNLEQACLYVTYLAGRLLYSSVIAYYSAVVFMHVCRGYEPVRVSNPILRATLEGIGRQNGKDQKGKDPIFPIHLKKVAAVVEWVSDWEFLTFVCIVFLFRTLLRVSHVVWSSHTLLRSDVKFNVNGMLVAVRSSKTRSKGEEVAFLPVLYADCEKICAVKLLKKFLVRFPKKPDEQLFSIAGRKYTYNRFSENFSRLLGKAGIHGDFASHSLRRGGATHMSMAGCSVAEIKQRGLWKSSCVFKYIQQPISHKIKVDKKVVARL